jgi:beta-N-acetylhexosaminidase
MRRRRSLAVLLLVAGIGATALLTTGPAPTPVAVPQSGPTAEVAVALAARQRAAALVADWPVERKLAQLLVLSVHGSDLDTPHAGNTARHGVATIREVLERYEPGGVVYFGDVGPAQGGNLVDPVQIRALSDGIHAALPIPPLIAADTEHGIIERLPEPATLLPGAMAVGAAGDRQLAADVAQTIAFELRALGVDVNFAPVADVHTNLANPIIGLRAFGADPEAVGAMVAASVAGHAAAGVAATAKHFPGHGDTSVDSHVALPTIPHDRARLDAVELAPFRAAIAAGVPLVMVGHLDVPALDASGTPASLSVPITTDLLRGELGFDGVVVTDALDMAALRPATDPAGAAVGALRAGADLLLMPVSTPAAVEALATAAADGTVPAARIDQAVQRVVALKIALGLLDGDERPPVTDVGGAPQGSTALALGLRSMAVLGGCLPVIGPGDTVTLVGPDASRTLAAAQAELVAGGVDVIALRHDRNPTPAQRAAALIALRSSAVAAVVVDRPSVRSGERELADMAGPLAGAVVVVTGLPTELSALSTPGATALTFGDSASAGLALAEVLRGRGAPGGTSPAPTGTDLPPVTAAACAR